MRYFSRSHSVYAKGDCECAVLTAMHYREALREGLDYEAPEEQEEEEEEEEESTESEEEEESEDSEQEEPTPPPSPPKRNMKHVKPPPKNIFQEKLDIDIDAFERPVFPKSEKEAKRIEKANKQNAFLKSLPEETFVNLTAAFEKSKVRSGTEIIRQGDDDGYYYVISKGECEVEVNGVKQANAVRKAGESFGEEALKTRAPRKHSIIAKSDVEVFKVDQATYRKLLQKDAHEERMRKRAMLENLAFLDTISDENREKLLAIMQEKKFRKGEKIVKKEDSGKTFIIVAEGEVTCGKVASKYRGEREDMKLGPGQFFGQQLLYAVRDPVKGEVTGSKSGTVYTISKEDYRKVIGSSLDLVPVEDRTLGAITALQRSRGKYLSEGEILRLSHRIHNIKYKAGDIIVQEGVETEAAIYIVREGRVHSTQGGNERLKGRMTTLLNAGSHFGEELFEEAKKNGEMTGISKYQLIADSKCIVGVLTIHDCLDALSDDNFKPAGKKDENEKSKKKVSKKPPKSKQAKWPKCDIDLHDLERLVCLGQGNFGQVWLVEDKQKRRLGKKPCVIKIQAKQHLIETGQAKVCIDEKQLLQCVQHPFIVDLVNAYQDPGYVYMLLEYLPGGELYNIMNPMEGTAVLPEPLAKFYALSIADAFAYIHSKNIIFRDLKPENILIDAQGYPKLIDFGFAKRIDGKTFTLCGTPGYLAPEVVLNVGHGKAVDHFQLGVLIYDMLAGESPFFEDDVDQEELFRMVIEDDIPDMDTEISDEAWDLIEGLLEKDPRNRLGSLKRGERDILHHKWFDEIPLPALRKRTFSPPWKPDIPDPWDTSNFEDWSDLEDITAGGCPELAPEDAKMFARFDQPWDGT